MADELETAAEQGFFQKLLDAVTAGPGWEAPYGEQVRHLAAQGSETMRQPGGYLPGVAQIAASPFEAGLRKLAAAIATNPVGPEAMNVGLGTAAYTAPAWLGALRALGALGASRSGQAGRIGESVGAIQPRGGARARLPGWRSEMPAAVDITLAEAPAVLRAPNAVRPMPEGWVTDPQGTSQLYLGSGPRELPYVEYAMTRRSARGQGGMSNLLLRALRQAGGRAQLGAPTEGSVSDEMRSLLRGLEELGLLRIRETQAPSSYYTPVTGIEPITASRRLAELTPAGWEFPFSGGVAP